MVELQYCKGQNTPYFQQYCFISLSAPAVRVHIIVTHFGAVCYLYCLAHPVNPTLLWSNLRTEQKDPNNGLYYTYFLMRGEGFQVLYLKSLQESLFKRVYKIFNQDLLNTCVKYMSVLIKEKLERTEKHSK